MALRRPRSKGKTAGGCLTLVAALVVVGLVSTVGRDFVDGLLNPWAHSWRGDPTLTGTWVGAVTSPAGQKVGVFLELHRAQSSRGRYSTCRHCPRIKGAARTCGGDGTQSYEVWGGPDTWGGEQFHLKAGSDAPEQAGPRLYFLRGEWSGDALKVTTALEHSGEGGGEFAGREVRFEMGRGTEGDFMALCQKLGAD